MKVLTLTPRMFRKMQAANVDDDPALVVTAAWLAPIGIGPRADFVPAAVVSAFWNVTAVTTTSEAEIVSKRPFCEAEPSIAAPAESPIKSRPGTSSTRGEGS